MKPMRDNPCHGCVAPKRHTGCHGTCGDYIVAKAFHIDQLKVDNERTAIDSYTIDNSRKNADRARKGKQTFRGCNWRHC